MIKKEMKKIGILVTLVIMALVLAACAKTPTEPAEEVIEEPETEPVITYSDFRANNMVPEDKIPEYYTEVVINGIKDRVWGYTDDTGSIQYMVFTDQDTLTDGEVTETKNGFVPIEITSDETEEVVSETVVTEDVTLPANTEEKPIYSYAFKEKAEFIEHKDEKPGKGTPVDIPEGSIVKTIVGAVNELNEKAGLYELVIDKLENPIVFAAFNLGEEDEVATFYPATEDGEMIEGALPLTCVYLEENGEKVATLPEDAVYDTTKKEDEVIGTNTVENVASSAINNDDSDDAENSPVVTATQPEQTSQTNTSQASQSSSSSQSSPQSSSQSSTSTSTASTQTHQHNWVAVTEQKWVQDSAAWDETVLVKDAWDETVTTYVEESRCVGYRASDGTIFSTLEEVQMYLLDFPAAQANYSTVQELVQIPVETTVHHEAEYTTIHHDATGHYEDVTTGYKCSSCGARK